MKWSDISFEPTLRTLRQFSGLWILFFLVISGMNLFVWPHPWRAALFAALGLTIGLWGLTNPASMRWIYIGWIVCVFPIGWVVSRFVVALVFYGIFTPVAFLFRLIGRDALDIRLRGKSESYWAQKSTPQDVGDYFHQS